MKILVIGGGAREHALVWRLAGERQVADIVCAPGNAGIARLARCVDVDVADAAAILSLADRELVDFTIVGPELPLSRGVADLFAAEGRMLLGPRRAAAALESSKVFAKDFMSRHGVPTARYVICESADEARMAIERSQFGWPIVLKADGLAAGKGVVVAPDRSAALAAVEAAMVDRRLGDAGATLVIEDHLAGREASFFVLTDGTRAVRLPSAEDHKRRFDGDLGPNTGGMGAFAPSPLIDGAMSDRVLREIVEPVLRGMRHEGCEYRGFLYVGLMLTADGPKVIEFNVRLGDPEAQVILPMIEDDLLPLLVTAASGRLDQSDCRVAKRPHVAVSIVSDGYPDSYQTGKSIAGLADAEALADVIVFHAGTAVRGSDIVTAGGRVLTVVGRGDDYAAAIAHAYAAVDCIQFDGLQFRRDIGRRAIQ